MPPKKKKKKSQVKSKKVSKKKAAKKAPAKKAAPKKHAALKLSRVRGKGRSVGTTAFEPEEVEARSGGEAGSLQGLSDIAEADSESVDELLEEGNAFEAEAVKGVEDAPEPDRGEVRTHQVPEGDVPEEYLDKDQ
jgi:N utilization substance protein A